MDEEYDCIILGTGLTECVISGINNITYIWPVLRIHEILLLIRIRGSILRLVDPDPDSDPAIFVSDLQDVNKNKK